MEILREVTQWNCGYTVCNHTYLMHNNKVLAFADSRNGNIVKLSKPFALDKRYRKFIAVDYPELAKSVVIAPSDKPKTENNPIKKANTRTFAVKSKDKNYTVEYNTLGKFFSCSCVGFGFRGKCKHVDGVKNHLKI